MKPDLPHDVPAPLRCPFCRVGFEQGSTSIACGTCLATHHGACWEEGGWQCAACGEAACLTVKRSGQPAAGDRAAWGTRLLVGVLSCALVAALLREPPEALGPSVGEGILCDSAEASPEEEATETLKKHACSIAKAQHALARCEWRQALTLFDAALSAGTQDPAPLWVGRATALRELGKPRRALAHVTRALAEHPTHHGWRLLRGDLHLELGNQASALEDYTAVLLSSDHAFPRVALLVRLLERQQELPRGSAPAFEVGITQRGGWVNRRPETPVQLTRNAVVLW